VARRLLSVRPPILAFVAMVVVGAGLLVWAVAQGDGASPRARPAQDTVAAVPAATVNRFNGDRAFALLREQVERFGWRPAGSAALRRLAVRLRPLLPHGRFEAIPHHPRLRNVVGVLPGRRPAILVGAHYDVEVHPPGFVGANDGAAGTAAVVELARALSRARRPRDANEIRFVLFDGEEDPLGCTDARFYTCALRGSRAYAAAHAGQISDMVLLDYIAEKQSAALSQTLSFPREAGSNPVLWGQLRSAAQAVGVGSLFPDAGAPYEIIDDHTPFARRGIAAIDIIDFAYPPADGLRDTLDNVSERSLDAVGEAASRLRSETLSSVSPRPSAGG